MDARIPVRLGVWSDLTEDDAMLFEGADAAHPGRSAAHFLPASAAHAACCGCCFGRSQAAAALDLLFQRRARGHVPFFRRVLAVTMTREAEAEIRSALRADPLVSSRFRLEPA